MDKLEKGHVYSVEWVDGFGETSCTFVGRNKGFIIFIDENNMKVICRETSIKNIKKINK